jgi:hypothetical protein
VAVRMEVGLVWVRGWVVTEEEVVMNAAAATSSASSVAFRLASASIGPMHRLQLQSPSGTSLSPSQCRWKTDEHVSHATSSPRPPQMAQKSSRPSSVSSTSCSGRCSTEGWARADGRGDGEARREAGAGGRAGGRRGRHPMLLR